VLAAAAVTLVVAVEVALVAHKLTSVVQKMGVEVDTSGPQV
jgi:ribosomal protein L12E/L44/L45/RPP1/RPP2